jgi:hypothetical protein
MSLLASRPDNGVSKRLGLFLTLVQLAFEAIPNNLLLIGIGDILKPHHDQMLIGIHRKHPHDFSFEFCMGNGSSLIA